MQISSCLARFSEKLGHFFHFENSEEIAEVSRLPLSAKTRSQDALFKIVFWFFSPQIVAHAQPSYAIIWLFTNVNNRLPWHLSPRDFYRWRTFVQPLIEHPGNSFAQITVTPDIRSPRYSFPYCHLYHLMFDVICSQTELLTSKRLTKKHYMVFVATSVLWSVFREWV